MRRIWRGIKVGFFTNLYAVCFMVTKDMQETKKMGRSTRLELTKTIYLSDDEDENGFQHLNI